MLDLSFGLPITVRDAALKMVAPGPNSSINREYYAQEHERELEEGRGAVEAYEKTDEKARDLLRRLANSEPYYKKQRRLEASGETQEKPSEQKQIGYGPGPVRTQDNKRGGSGGVRGGRGGVRGGGIFPSTAQVPPSPADILPPADPNITSLFVTGVEDDLPEHALRAFFAPFGTIRSLICSHRSHCAFINYAHREGAEKAAEHCQGRAVVQGCPLRIKWGKPKPLDNLDREERMVYAREGRQTTAASETGAQRAITSPTDAGGQPQAAEEEDNNFVVAPPPGTGNVTYASLAGD
jgi:pre-mRNA-splicing factor RBM22/SLT11